MSKELPYYKFHPAEWIKGDITLCSMEAQGVFINLCSYYWLKDCSISLANAKQRFSKNEASIDELLNNEIISLDENENVIINFLDEQMQEFIDISQKRALAGREGGLAKAKQKSGKPVAKLSNKEKIREDKRREDKINIEFDIFWNLYDKKVGAKDKCLKKWNSLQDEEREKIIISLPEWKAKITDKQFQPFPETYLNQKRWNDEVIKIKNQPTSKPL